MFQRFAWVLSFFLALSCAQASAVTIGVGGNLSTPEVINTSDTTFSVTVSVNATGTVGLNTGGFALRFDTDFLELLSVTPAAIPAGIAGPGADFVNPGVNNGVQVADGIGFFSFVPPFTATEFDVATLSFEVVSGVSGTTTVDILASAEDAFQFVNGFLGVTLPADLPTFAQINFTAEPIPLPATVWMMLGVIVLGGLIRSRKAAA
ncbi:MAG: hypothetical protein AAGE80_05695 [Pseudomonadota bacterium]